MTHRQNVLSILAVSSSALDDDELARRAGIAPRQTVNLICRQLAAEGLVVRSNGPDGKITNALSGRDVGQARPSVVTPVQQVAAKPHSAASSHEQRAAEAVMRMELSRRLGLELAPRRLLHPSGARVEIDAADENLTVLVECWAHQGPAKVAQKSKLVNDAVKLHWIARTLTPSPQRLILCVSDEAAVRHLRGTSWQGQAIADLGVELFVVKLPAEVVASITEAQRRQYR